MTRYTGKSAMEIGDPPGWRNRGERLEPVERCQHGVRLDRECDECDQEIEFENAADECAERFGVCDDGH